MRQSNKGSRREFFAIDMAKTLDRTIMRITLAALVLFLLPALSFASQDIGDLAKQNPLADYLKQYPELERAATDQEIKDIDKIIIELNSKSMYLKTKSKLSKAKKKEISEALIQMIRLWSEKQDRLRSGKDFAAPWLRLGKVQIGNIGTIIPPDSFRLNSPMKLKCKVLQIIDSMNFLLQVKWQMDDLDFTPHIFWIDGIGTANLVDDMELELGEVFIVKQNKTYPTADGATRTVFVLQPIDIHTLKLKLQ